MKVLITGGGGMVGKAFSTGYKILKKDCDFTDFQQTLKIIKKINPQGIIHCAAKVGGVLDNMQNKGRYYYENILMNSHVIEAARICNVKHLVAYLSTCVFPDKASYPLTVDQLHLGEPHESNYPYGYAKRMVEVQIRAYRQQYHLNYSCIIPSNIYGPEDNFSLKQGHVIPMLIHKMYLAHRDKTDLRVWGSGKPIREFIFARDIAEISQWVLENYKAPEPLIISGDQPICIKDLVDLLAQEFGFTGKIIFDTSFPDGQYEKPSDNSKIKLLLPHFKYTPLKEGLKETIHWFTKNYAYARK